MCRLYGFLSNTPRKIECELIQSQNSLMAQSVRDEEGYENPHGWGIGQYKHKLPYVVKQAEPASASDTYRWTMTKSNSDHVISHVRRATEGEVRWENAHPFVHGRLMLAHNGHISHFDQVRERILEEIDDPEKELIDGTTDSEHILALVHHFAGQSPVARLSDILRMALTRIIEWSDGLLPEEELALNVVVSNGSELVASRYYRSLYYVIRDEVHACEKCAGAPQHIEANPENSYRAVAVASEPITSNEKWSEVPNKHILYVSKEVDMKILDEPLP